MDGIMMQHLHNNLYPLMQKLLFFLFLHCTNIKIVPSFKFLTEFLHSKWDLKCVLHEFWKEKRLFCILDTP